MIRWIDRVIRQYRLHTLPNRQPRFLISDHIADDRFQGMLEAITRELLQFPDIGNPALQILKALRVRFAVGHVNDRRRTRQSS